MLRTRIATVLCSLAGGALALAAVRPALVQEHAEVPTQEHRMLQKGAGDYEGTITMFMPGMDATPMPATETVEPFGAFWTTVSFESEFMDTPYHGRGTVGYSANKGKFVGTWYDGMSSHLSYMEGDYDEASGKLIMRWEAPDMMGVTKPHRSERVETENGYTMTFFIGDGEGTKSMEIAMKRTGARPAEASHER